jgi:hypothetical protein
MGHNRFEVSYRRYFKWATADFDGIVEGRFCCPCCGYPTLGSWGEHGICLICWWEDDGTGDRAVMEVTGGPNGSYSLAEARANFEDHGDMYRFDTTRIPAVSEPSRERLALLQFIRGREGDAELDCEAFFRLLEAEKSALFTVKKPG